MIVMADRLLTTAEAAKALGVSQTTLNSWARNGLVTPAYVTPGRQRRWDLDDLRRQLNYRRNEGG